MRDQIHLFDRVRKTMKWWSFSTYNLSLRKVQFQGSARYIEVPVDYVDNGAIPEPPKAIVEKKSRGPVTPAEQKNEPKVEEKEQPKAEEAKELLCEEVKQVKETEVKLSEQTEIIESSHNEFENKHPTEFFEKMGKAKTETPKAKQTKTKE